MLRFVFYELLQISVLLDEKGFQFDDGKQRVKKGTQNTVDNWLPSEKNPVVADELSSVDFLLVGFLASILHTPPVPLKSLFT